MTDHAWPPLDDDEAPALGPPKPAAVAGKAALPGVGKPDVSLDKALGRASSAATEERARRLSEDRVRPSEESARSSEERARPSEERARLSEGPARTRDDLLATQYLAAPVWRRCFAWLIDLVVPLTAWALATWALIASDPEPLELPPWNLFDQIVDYLHDRPGRAFLSLTLFVALQIAWPFVFGARTPGKRALDVMLLAGDGRPPSRWRVLGWAIWRVPSLALAGLGGWWALLDPERRTLHDRLARVWLVRSPGQDKR